MTAGVIVELLVAIGAIADVGSLFGLDLEILLLAVGIVVGGPVMLVAIRILKSSGQLKAGVVALIAIAVSGGLLGAAGAYKISDSPKARDKQSGTYPDLSFRVQNGPFVNQCTVYQGDGRIPDAGFILVVFNRPVGPSGNPTGGFYMARESAENNADGTGWRTPPVEAGDRYVQITAVIMLDDLFNSLLSIKPADEGLTNAWLMEELPSGQRINSFIVQPRMRTATDKSGCD